MKKAIAFFDFDGTITTKDTLLAFIRFSKGSVRFLAGFLWNSPFLVAYKLRLISNQTAKEKILRHFFNEMPVDEFRSQCALFKKTVLPRLLRPKALEEIRKLKAAGSLVVVVSASPENWIRDWAEETGVQLIASRLETREGKITGRIVGKNCHGEEKVKRILEHHAMADYEVIYAYGDTSGDKPMLQLATEAFYRPFRR